MIRRIRGELVAVQEQSVLIEAGNLCYEVFVAEPVRDRLAERGVGTQVELHTYHYLSNDQSKLVPYLLGFESQVQAAFFERLLEVPRVGPLLALRMMVLPVATLATAIETQDTKTLQSLPGVGKQKARDIIATLQGKLGRFVDLKELESKAVPAHPLGDVEADALEILTQLGFATSDALRSISAVLAENPEIASAEEVVRRVFASR